MKEEITCWKEACGVSVLQWEYPEKPFRIDSWPLTWHRIVKESERALSSIKSMIDQIWAGGYNKPHFKRSPYTSHDVCQFLWHSL